MNILSLQRRAASARLRSWLCLLVVALAGLGPNSPAQPKGESLDDYLKKLGYESVLLRRTEHNELLADGMLGQKKCVLLVDTGWCSMTTLDGKVGTRFKTLGELGVTLEDSFLGPLTNSSIVLVDKLGLGRAAFLNQPARVEKLRVDYISVPFDGVLGFDFYLRNSCLIDCWGHRLYLRGSAPTADQSKALAETLQRSGFVGVPMKTDRGFTIEARVNKQPIRLLVDTGAALSTLDESQSQFLGLKPVRAQETGSLIPEKVNFGIIGFGDISQHKMWVTKLTELQIGHRAWKNLYFGVVPLKAWRIEAFGTGPNAVHGLFGADMLATSHSLIDLASGMLWLGPVKDQH